MTSFSLVQLKDETDLQFTYRVYGRATEWCPTAAETDIPKEGAVRDVWDAYLSTKGLTDAELAAEVYEAVDNDTRYSQDIVGVYARTWLTLLHAEEYRRKTSK